MHWGGRLAPTPPPPLLIAPVWSRVLVVTRSIRRKSFGFCRCIICPMKFLYLHQLILTMCDDILFWPYVSFQVYLHQQEYEGLRLNLWYCNVGRQAGRNYLFVADEGLVARICEAGLYKYFYLPQLQRDMLGWTKRQKCQQEKQLLTEVQEEGSVLGAPDEG